uniref:Uncharacterized protein n=1 Tax=Dugesia ryukyuensis TaxID=79738 RepID=A7M6E0_DUGRY|nr:hypothetical protein [Dugesia ryukyuensis]
MSSVQCEEYFLKHSDYGDHIKIIHDRSASTISDCYSSDDDYKEGILHDYLLNQSTVLLSNEETAFDNDEKKIEENLISDKDCQEQIDEDNWKATHNQKLSKSSSNININTSPINEISPEYLFDKCISEFYRPPSRPKDSFIRTKKNFEDDTSILVHHFTEFDQQHNYLKSSQLKNNVINKEDGDNDLSASLFNSNKPFKECRKNVCDDSTIKLLSTGSLNSHTQSSSIDNMFNLPNSDNNLFLDYEFENFSQSELLRKSKTGPLIKSTTAQFSTSDLHKEISKESLQITHTEKCVGTSLIYEENNQKTHTKYYRGNEGTGDTSTNLLCEDVNSINRLPSILTYLQHHVDQIVANNNSSTNQNLLYIDVNRKSDWNDLSNNQFNEYSDDLVKDLFDKIKHMYFQLDSKIKYPVIKKKSVKHKRHFSEVPCDRTVLYSGGNPEIILGISCHKDKIQDPKMHYSASTNICESELQTAQDHKDLSCRIFELNPYDDLIKSYQSHSDRRIKAVGNKMKCKIVIEGPIRIYDSTNACWNMRNKIAYRCSLNGPTKEAVEKCLKCLQDTFPQSCLNEKHNISKIENKQTIS